MKIALIEAFSTGSHRAWLEGVTKHSCHQVTPFSLPGRFWKWRMHGGAISLADQLEQSGLDFDLILCTDMMDLALFKGLLSARYRDIPTALYFHENQLTYPWSPDDADVAEKRDHHYAFINYSSALVADGVFFNSDFHRQSFLEELPVLLKQFPDFREERKVLELVKKCQTLTLGTDLSKFLSPLEEKSQVPTILWNHRWEYDKNPEEFFELLENLSQKEFKFNLVVLGARSNEAPACFERACQTLESHIIHWGSVASPSEYAQWLQRCDILPVTGIQDFFGVSVVEGIYAGLYPLLPNRLAYPQHIPAKLQEHYLYQNSEDLERRLINLLANWQTTSVDPSLVEHVACYDWTRTIAEYDAEFEKLAKK